MIRNASLISGHKIPKEDLFIQVAYNDLLRNLWLILFFRVNCEIYMSYDLIDTYKEEDLAYIASILDRRGIIRRLHAPLRDPYAAGFDIFKDLYRKSIRVSRALGIKSIIMHLEYDRARFPSIEQWFCESKGAWEWIARSSSEDKVEVLIENHEETTAEPVVMMIKHLNSPSVGACYDVGHYNVFGDKAVKDHLGLYEGVVVREIHLSDNMGDIDSHLPLGKGDIDFPGLFRSIEAKDIRPVYTIEAKDLAGVLGGMRHLRRLKKI